MESLNEMIEKGYRVYILSMRGKLKNLKIVKVYRYPDLIFVKDKK